jgi:CheY-like chemotaxis protein
MDVQMPILDGLGATKMIRANPRARVVENADFRINSQCGSELYRDSCRSAGMYDFLAKPIGPEQLVIIMMAYFPISNNNY